jgi:hypothetical protein
MNVSEATLEHVIGPDVGTASSASITRKAERATVGMAALERLRVKLKHRWRSLSVLLRCRRPAASVYQKIVKEFTAERTQPVRERLVLFGVVGD